MVASKRTSCSSALQFCSAVNVKDVVSYASGRTVIRKLEDREEDGKACSEEEWLSN